jgi:para-nitrobenzyl esterase
VLKSLKSIPRRLRIIGTAAAAGVMTLSVVTAVELTTTAHASPLQTGCAAGTDITTTFGPICGIVNPANGASERLGVPFAAPPVGALRWQPPQPPTPWTTTLPTVAYTPVCAQQAGLATTLPLQGSEDCLYVNVFRPAGATPGANLPVMVHIHGGGFRTGNGQGDYSLMATTGNEVIVSVQYRLGRSAAAVWISPSPADQPPVPAKQRVHCEQPAGPQ